MKYFIAFALIAAVASAGLISNKPTPISDEEAQILEIIAAINSPSTDPATAAILEQMLHDLLYPIPDHPISVGPEIIHIPIPETPFDLTPIAPAPVAPVAPASSPLVQIIVNVNQADSAPVFPKPVDIVDVTPVLPVPEPEAIPIPTEPILISPDIMVPVVPAPAPLN